MNRIFLLSFLLTNLVFQLKSQSPTTDIWSKSPGPNGGTLNWIIEKPDGTLFGDFQYKSSDEGLTWQNWRPKPQPDPTLFSAYPKIQGFSDGYWFAFGKNTANLPVKFTSTDDGETWSATPINSFQYGSPVSVVVRDSIWYGFFSWASTVFLQKSSDAGINWTPLSQFGPNAAVSGLTWDAAGKMYLLARNLGGLGQFLKSEDGGFSWQIIFNLQTPGGSYVGFQAPVFLPSGEILVAATEGLVKVAANKTDWAMVNDSLGNPRIFQSVVLTDAGTLLATQTPFSFGNGFFKPRLWISFDNGENWQLKNDGLAENSAAFWLKKLQSGTILLMDYYYNGHRIYKSTDDGNSWQAAGQGIFQPSIYQLLVNPANGNWLVETLTGWHRTTDLGQTWVETQFFVPDRKPAQMQFDKNGNLFAYFFAAQSTVKPKLFKSSDDGTTWTDCTPTSVFLSGWDVKLFINPTNADLYVFDETAGIFCSKNSGASWELLNSTDELRFVSQVSFSNQGDLMATIYSSPILKRSFDGGKKWAELSKFSNYNIENIHVSAWGDVFAWDNYSGFVFRTNNFGSTWQKIKLPANFDSPENMVSTASGFVFLTGRWQVWVSDDFGISWILYDKGIAMGTSFCQSCPENWLLALDPVNHFLLAGGKFNGGLYFTDQLFPAISTISGTVAKDENTNCQTDSTEIKLENWVVEGVVGGVKNYASTDENGKYRMPFFVLDSAGVAVDLSVRAPNQLWEGCFDTLSATLFPNLDSTVLDFPQHGIIDCPMLDLSLGFLAARPCFGTSAYFQVCNNGTLPAAPVILDLVADAWLAFSAASVPLLGSAGDTLKFALPDLPIGGCFSGNVDFAVDCGAPLGATVCLTGHVFPDSFCLGDPSWSGAWLTARGRCEADTAVVFSVRNVGTGASTQNLEYIVIEDQVILRENLMLPLAPTDSMVIRVPANGKFKRLEMEQEPLAPVIRPTVAWVEGCGFGAASLGFVNDFPCGDGNPFVETECRELTNSFDPNEKKAQPEGVGGDHFLLPGTPLKYVIYFQNTGTDTAFNVVLRDTLSNWLDAGSVRPGASSHLYKFEIGGFGHLVFRFENIFLPDSNANERASHGFVSFEIEQKKDVPIGALVRNRAGIYFDFNPAVLTNLVQHKVDTGFLEKMVVRVSPEPVLERKFFKISPNPAAGKTTARLEKSLVNQTSRFRYSLFFPDGQLAETGFFENENCIFPKKSLPGGLYFFRLENAAGGTVGWENVFLK